MEQKKLERFVCYRAIGEIRELIENFNHTYQNVDYIVKMLDGIKEIEIVDAEQLFDGTITLKTFKICGETFYSKHDLESKILEKIREDEMKKENIKKSKVKQVCIMPITLTKFFGNLISPDKKIVEKLEKGVKYRYIIIMEEMLSKINIEDYDCDYCFVYGFKSSNRSITKFPVFYGTDDIKRLIFNYEYQESAGK